MGKQISEVIAEHEAKVISLTTEEILQVWRDAWFAGHETSRYCPNVSGQANRDFINSAVFDLIKGGL